MCLHVDILAVISDCFLMCFNLSRGQAMCSWKGHCHNKEFADRPVDCPGLSSNSAFAKCCFRETGAEGVGSDFPPACLWSVFVSWFEATPPTCCDRKGINSASRQNKRKSPQRKMMWKTIKCVMHIQSHCSPLNSDILDSEESNVGEM